MGRVAPVRSIVLRSCRPPRWLFVALLFNKVITAWKPGNWVQGSAKHQKHYTHNVLAVLGVWNISKMSIVQDLSSTVTPFMWWWKGKRIRKPRWSNNTINYHPSYQKILTHLSYANSWLSYAFLRGHFFATKPTYINILDPHQTSFGFKTYCLDDWSQGIPKGALPCPFPHIHPRIVPHESKSCGVTVCLLKQHAVICVLQIWILIIVSIESRHGRILCASLGMLSRHVGPSTNFIDPQHIIQMRWYGQMLIPS